MIQHGLHQKRDAAGLEHVFRDILSARLQIGGAPERLFAQQVALNRAAEFRALGAEAARGLPETVTYAGRDWQLAVTETETLGGYTELRIQAVGPGGEGALVVGFVGEEEAAG